MAKWFDHQKSILRLSLIIIVPLFSFSVSILFINRFAGPAVDFISLLMALNSFGVESVVLLINFVLFCINFVFLFIMLMPVWTMQIVTLYPNKSQTAIDCSLLALCSLVSCTFIYLSFAYTFSELRTILLVIFTTLHAAFSLAYMQNRLRKYKTFHK